MSDRRARAEAVLQAHGLRLDALAAGALTVSVARAGLAAPDGAVFLDALAEIGDESVAAVLAALDVEGTERAQRKAIRRALHRLRERGVAFPTRGATAPAAPITRPDAEREAWLSAVDGVGTRLAWVAVSLSSGALLLVAAELNEPAGLVDLRVSEVPRKQLRAARQHLRERGVPLVPAPFETVDALLVEGQQRRGDVERRLDYLRVRPRLTRAAPAAPGEPQSSRATTPDDDEIEALVAASATLLSEPEFALWWPRPTDAEPFLQEIEELEASPIVLSPAQQESRLAATLACAAAALYPRPAVARRLRATAYVLAESGRAAAARTALAVARALERDATDTRDVPLLTTLVHQGLGRLAAARAAERQTVRERSLVITPGEALRDRSPGRPRHTRS